MRSTESKTGNLRGRTLALAAFVSLGSFGCGAGAYVWVDTLGDAAALSSADSVYTIAAGDLLNIRVYDQDAISTRSRVGPDGKIALPLVGEIEAQGQRPSALARQIEVRLKPFIVAPSVAITVEEAQSVRISVVGEVARPGVFAITPGTGVVQALALAGGSPSSPIATPFTCSARAPPKRPSASASPTLISRAVSAGPRRSCSSRETRWSLNERCPRRARHPGRAALGRSRPPVDSSSASATARRWPAPRSTPSSTRP